MPERLSILLAVALAMLGSIVHSLGRDWHFSLAGAALLLLFSIAFSVAMIARR